MDSDAICYNIIFHAITYRSCDTLPLIIFMNIQFIQVSRFVNISKPYNQIIFNCNISKMSQK